MQRRKWKSRLKKALWIVGLLIVGGEVFFRVAYHEVLRSQARPAIFRHDSLLGYRYIPNADGYICVPGAKKSFRTNEAGYIGRWHDKRKPTGIFRIAIVDASHGTGIWTSGEENFADILQRKFDQAQLGVEIFNFSIDGSNRGLSKIFQIESEVIQYAPDVVLMSLEMPLPDCVFFREYYRGYVCDIGHSKMPKGMIDSVRERVRLQVDEVENESMVTLYDLSYLVRAYFRWSIVSRGKDTPLNRRMDIYINKRVPIEWRFPAMEERQSIGRIARMRKRLRQAGSELVFFSFHRNAEEAPRKVGELLGVQVISASLSASGYGQESNAHFNAQGHLAVAEELFPQLRDLVASQGE